MHINPHDKMDVRFIQEKQSIPWKKMIYFFIYPRSHSKPPTIGFCCTLVLCHAYASGRVYSTVGVPSLGRNSLWPTKVLILGPLTHGGGVDSGSWPLGLLGGILGTGPLGLPGRFSESPP